jgi:hypothetical protein
MNLAAVLNAGLSEQGKVKIITRIFVGDAASGQKALDRMHINGILNPLNDFLNRVESTLSADSLNTVMDLLANNLKSVDLVKNINTIEELQRTVDASAGDAELLDGIIHIATMVDQSINMIQVMTKVVADLNTRGPQSAELILALKAYIQGAIEDDNGLSLLVSLQKIANTLKSGGQLDGSIIAALQSKETLGRVAVIHTVDDSLKIPHEGFSAKPINEDNAGATAIQKEVNDQEFVESWHAFLISKQKIPGQEGEFSVAESYKKFHEFLVSPDGFNLSHEQTMQVLRGIIAKRVDDNKPLTIDSVRHDFKAHFKKEVMDWVLHGDASTRVADARFDGNDPAQVQGSLDRLNTLTTHGLNVKDQGNFAESWYEAYKASRGEGIETQLVLRENENDMVGLRNEFEVTSTDSAKRKPDFADQVPDARTANSQDMVDLLALGEVKSHKGSLSKDDEKKIRAYLRAVSHAVDAQNPQLGTRGAKARNGKGEIELPHQYQSMRLVFTNADGAIASSKMLSQLMNDFPSEFTIVFFNPHTGARIKLDFGSLKDYKTQFQVNTVKEVIQALSKPSDTEVSLEAGS